MPAKRVGTAQHAFNLTSLSLIKIYPVIETITIVS
jgi:hypothetical protein